MMLVAALLALQAPPIETTLPAVQDRPAETRTVEARLEDRLTALAAVEDPAQGQAIADEVISLWRQLAGPTAQLLLARGEEALAAGEASLAERQYAHLRRLEPEFSEAWVVSAEAAMQRSEWSFALEALDRAIALEPRRFDAYVLLGRTLEQADSPAGALEAYEAALAIHPHHEGAREATQRLEARLSGRAL